MSGGGASGSLAEAPITVMESREPDACDGQGRVSDFRRHYHYNALRSVKYIL